MAVNDEDLAGAFANEGRSFNELWVAYPGEVIMPKCLEASQHETGVHPQLSSAGRISFHLTHVQTTYPCVAIIRATPGLQSCPFLPTKCVLLVALCSSPLRHPFSGGTRLAGLSQQARVKLIRSVWLQLVGPTFRWLLYGDDDTQVGSFTMFLIIEVTAEEVRIAQCGNL